MWRVTVPTENPPMKPEEISPFTKNTKKKLCFLQSNRPEKGEKEIQDNEPSTIIENKFYDYRVFVCVYAVKFFFYIFGKIIHI